MKIKWLFNDNILFINDKSMGSETWEKWHHQKLSWGRAHGKVEKSWEIIYNEKKHK